MLCVAEEEGVGCALAASVSGFFSSVAMTLKPTGRKPRIRFTVEGLPAGQTLSWRPGNKPWFKKLVSRLRGRVLAPHHETLGSIPCTKKRGKKKSANFQKKKGERRKTHDQHTEPCGKSGNLISPQLQAKRSLLAPFSVERAHPQEGFLST